MIKPSRLTVKMRSPDKIQSLTILKDRKVPVGTIIDVGVMFGTPELMKIFPDRKHILFEPVTEFAEAISRSYLHIEHELHITAVGDQDGSASLKTRSVLPGMEISHSSIITSTGATNTDVRTIPITKLDSFFYENIAAEPYLLKIDVDGQELSVLRGSTRTIRKCSIVIVECQKSEMAQRISMVESCGFTLFDLCEPCYYDKVFWQCDAIFIRNDFFDGRFEELKGKLTPGMYETFRINAT